jgi:hypothetical protein
MPELLGVGGCILGAILVILLGVLLRSIRLLYEYERGVILTWGKYTATRSAIFNGANIVVVNLVRPGDPWEGIRTDTDVGAMARQFLETIE